MCYSVLYFTPSTEKLLTLFSKNFSVYAIFNDQSFNNTLTNHIISSEQLGPVLFVLEKKRALSGAMALFSRMMLYTKIPPCSWHKQNWYIQSNPLYRLALWVKFSADNILKYFSYFSQKTGYDISCKLSPKETICMKCQILFSGKNKKNIINLSSAENAKRVVKVIQTLNTMT